MVKDWKWVAQITCIALLCSCDSSTVETFNAPTHLEVDTTEANAITPDTHKTSNIDTPQTPSSNGLKDSLPQPSKSSNKFSKVLGWPKEKTPIAPSGFRVTKYADELDNPRWIHVLPNGDVLVAEANTEVSAIKKALAQVVGKAKSQKLGKSANRITLFRDTDKDGYPNERHVFLDGLNQPFGMLLIKDKFYLANTDALLCYDYKPGQVKITSPAKNILSLPAGGYNNHWTRNIIQNKEGNKIYISVGSGSNIAEHGLENELYRANILEVNLDGSQKKIFASGLRNPVGMALHPETNKLWTVVNERDMLGDDLVPDYLTSVQSNGFYGWPWFYWGHYLDPRMKDKPQPIKKALVPDLALGAHTASLGLVFYHHKNFPVSFQNGAFIAQHGSWNRSELVGYKVIFVPFDNGVPAGPPVDFLTGFIADYEKAKVYGRPVGLAILADGSLLVADDASNTLWKVVKR